MKKLLITVLLAISIVATGQVNKSNIESGKKAADLIVGEWQEIEMTMAAPSMKKLDGFFQNPIFKNMMQAQLQIAGRLNFLSATRLIKSGAAGIDTATCIVSDTGFVVRKPGKVSPQAKFRIVKLNNDTLVYIQRKKADDPSVLELMKLAGAKPNPATMIIITHTAVRVPEAKAPWQTVASDLPSDIRLFNVSADKERLFAVGQRTSSDSAGSDLRLMVFNSIDKGGSWKKSGEVEIGMSMKTPDFTTFKGTYYMTRDSGVYSSNDGSVWRRLEEIKTDFANPFQAPRFATDDNYLLIAVGSMVYKTTDGLQWKQLKSPRFENYFIQNIACEGLKIALAGLDGDTRASFFFASSDEGDTWKNVSTALDEYPGLAITSLSIAGGMVFMDTQYGSFVLKEDGPPAPLRQIRSYGGSQLGAALFASIGGAITMTVLKTGARLFYGGLNGVFVSDDNGINWTEADNLETRAGVSLIKDGNDLLAITGDGKIFKASADALLQYAKHLKKQ